MLAVFVRIHIIFYPWSCMCRKNIDGIIHSRRFCLPRDTQYGGLDSRNAT